MENDFECVKIKDGLYIANTQVAQDYEFLVINKFAYIINCSAQIPNYFEAQGVKYLKFKFIKEKQHKLWDQSLKKLRKIQKFISLCEESSMCCLITSNQGNNRAMVMLVAYLMSKFRWSLNKTLEYVRSKSIYIGLTEHYIHQLQILQQILNQEKDLPMLTNKWQGEYINQEEELISKTFKNSNQINYNECLEPKPKKQRRIVWQDKIDKEKKKMKQSKSKELKQSKDKSSKDSKQKKSRKNLSQAALGQDEVPQKRERKVLTNNFLNSTGNAVLQLGLPPKQKKNMNNEGSSSSFHKFEKPTASQPKFILKNCQKDQEDKQQSANLQKQDQIDQKQLLKLIKKNLRLVDISNKMPANFQNQNKPQITSINGKQNFPEQCSQNSTNSNSQKIKDSKGNIYNLTINNFIQPSIQIVGDKKKKKQLQKQEYIALDNKNQLQIEENLNQFQKQREKNRIKSQKECLKSATNLNGTVKQKKKNLPSKQNGSKKSQNSPKVQKMQKALSIQYRKPKIKN